MMLAGLNAVRNMCCTPSPSKRTTTALVAKCHRLSCVSHLWARLGCEPVTHQHFVVPELGLLLLLTIPVGAAHISAGVCENLQHFWTGTL